MGVGEGGIQSLDTKDSSFKSMGVCPLGSHGPGLGSAPWIAQGGGAEAGGRGSALHAWLTWPEPSAA